MNKIDIYDNIVLKKQRLNEVQKTLKKEFIGLNNIIDEVINLITPWYLFPDAQLRPTVINMWGLTGSGKTALVNKMVELLDYKRLYVQMDMGEFESDSASWIKGMFTDDLEFFHEQPGIICFDEFQFARTINKEGNELGKDKLRVIWDLLDSGKVNYIPYHNSYYVVRAEICLVYLLKCEDKGVGIRDGVVINSESEFLNTFSDFYFENANRNGESVNSNYFLSNDFIDGVFYLYNDLSITRNKLKEIIENTDLKGIQRLLIEGMNKRTAIKQLDLSRGLIFVLGNLDEAYYMSHSMNPDISADELNEATLKINVAHIKKALQERFRNEQIARLGNNHIIFRSFTNQNFRDIITQKLNAINIYVKEYFNFEINFSENVVDVVYSEGVYPAQGTRPIFTTVKNVIEGSISKIVLEIIEKKLETNSVNWDYVDENFIFVFKDHANNTINTYVEKPMLKVGELRKINNKNLQAHTAVHESGHAILAALTLRIIPSLVVSKTVSATAEGFCMVNMPEGPLTREILKKEIIIGLGGYVAEKIIFGEEQTSSGVSSDIEKISEMANRAIKEYGMGNDPVFIRFSHTHDDLAIVHKSIHSEEVMTLIYECEQEAETILKRNKLLLLKMAQHLTSFSRIEEKEIKKMICDFASDAWVKNDVFVKKEDYFQFETVINNQINELENAIKA
ncbi:MAG: hypothetical protein V4667_05750 [Bacteroidota bacterium]